MEYSHFKEHTDRVVESCSRVIVGKEETRISTDRPASCT